MTDEHSCSLSPPPAEAERLFGEHLPAMVRYAELLAGPGVERGLIGPREVDRLWERHLLNCGAVAELIAPGLDVVDVGSGGGLPGIPLAIAFPDVSVTMVDIVQKKTAFLTQCRAELGLANAQSHWGHVEKLADATGYGVITSRAFAELVDFVNLAGHLLAPGGRMVAMKGVRPDAEIERLPAGWTVEAIERLTVPGLPAERHLVILAPSA